ncbi:hypothetical protein BC749_108176 [Flavobacterium araucananum]|uniref:Phage abortive infection protein n=1 Tax=Flavobacterium araucananum TaxID=946678 RepID=A0A227NSC2_9FLAO|nr:hypothetical protein [Flavobacterium araucananum]OXE99991.1 hypothetical protein B0A64_20755 [Flavobacterium araucananum]PWJ97026.1 hypothetical protein BC749_108176 [Flavobacterium araucananum]
MKKFIWIISIVGLLFMLFPISVFIINFSKHKISNDITQWGSFGDYIGGTLNTIIALASLIILAYLTHIVNVNSSEHNKNVNLLLRKLDSYEKISIYLMQIRQNKFKLYQELAYIEGAIARDQNADLNSYIEEMQVNLVFYKNLFYLIDSFSLMHGHLYKYDFNSNDFKQLQQHSNITYTYIEEILKRISTKNLPFPRKEDKEIFFTRLEQNFTTFLEKLHLELK